MLRGMMVSVVIPAFNEEKLLPECLRAVREAMAAFVARGWRSEVIVCDNNSTDRTAAVAEAGGARVVAEPVNQISRARNTGARAAQGDWLIFVDADSFPTRGLFEEVARAMEGGRCLAGGAVVQLDAPVFWAAAANRCWNWVSRLFRYAAGSFLFCQTAPFRETGGFSEALFVSEELELSRRLKKMARRRGQTMVIIKNQAIVTSARKIRLYSLADHLRFLGTLLRHGRAAARRREACPIWYEGRR